MTREKTEKIEPRSGRRTTRPPSEKDPDSALLRATGGSTLDAPRRIVDLSTGLPTLTSLFSDLWPIAEAPEGTTVAYVHIPSSSIVEERFGWEALEAYRGLLANYLVGLGQDMRRDRTHCVLARTFADDFVMLFPRREDDDELATRIADGMTRHLSAIDEETAALLQIYVGMAKTKPFPKIHPERRLYRAIQQAQTEATDVGRQRLNAQVRVLDRCISSRAFNMVYQPIVQVDDHAILAHEALVRCTDSELRSPHILFNVAEQGNRMWPLSRLLRRLAIEAVGGMPQDQCLFLNLHPLDFDDPVLYEKDGPVAKNAAHIVLEVTERAAILDLDHFRGQLKKLRDFGLKIAIDDLGSGYSALGLVSELDPDFIKLDMTLVRDIDESAVRQNLVRNMVSFARDLGAKVVAEGVERREELATVAELGCQLVQGYYLARPSPPFVEAIEVPPAKA